MPENSFQRASRHRVAHRSQPVSPPGESRGKFLKPPFSRVQTLKSLIKPAEEEGVDSDTMFWETKRTGR